jgi:DNA-binding CsgD family transcriptional regulator
MGRVFGRVTEIRALEQLLQEARDGRSGVLVLRGQPGIGKSALLGQLVSRAVGFRVVRAAGVESETELPFAGLHQLCASMLARLDSLAEPQRRALGIAFGLIDGDNPDLFLLSLAALSLMAEAAEEKPLLCVVDDAHWLDQASAQVLGFIGRRLLAEPIALVFAARDVFAATDVQTPPDHLAGLPELRLGGLDEEAAGSLLETVLSGPIDEVVRKRIIEETHGNPLALLELFRGLGAAELAGGFALPQAGDLPKTIEDQYIARLRRLPGQTQQLVLLAAADVAGETALVYRAAQALELDSMAIIPAVTAGLLDIGANVRFRHPLARSAAYRAASPEDRRRAHGALAAATDPQLDPDRRAWHRAQAAAVPEEAVAQELADSADRAQRRGGAAAAAAFWERAVVLTPDPATRASRALTAAEAKFAVGDFMAVQALLATAQAGPVSDLDSARVQRAAAHTAFALRRGRDAPPLLLQAAQRLEGLDAALAGQTYLEALVAAIYAGRLAREGDVQEIARAAASRPPDPGQLPHVRLLLRGLGLRLTDGYLAAAPVLKQALRGYRERPTGPDWLGVSYTLVAMDLWDDDAWFELAARLARQTRSTGTLGWLPFALDYHAEASLQAGDLAQTTALLAESERIDPGIRAAILPYVPLLLSAWQGNAAAAAEQAGVMASGAGARGEGAALTYVDYASAVLNNGLGRYELAAAAARSASAADELAVSPWALAELVEAAARGGQAEPVAAATDRLSAIASASGSDWARGVAARSRALVSVAADTADDLYAEAVELLGRTRMASQLARTRLCYGEWLRRENRRVDARNQLRPAFDAFSAMGAAGFAERARRELEATGERVRKRSDPSADLTPQEEQVAQLAREGRTNAEIGAQLFIGARTVEWHLRNIFVKLNISSRRELAHTLNSRRR